MYLALSHPFFFSLSFSPLFWYSFFRFTVHFSLENCSGAAACDLGKAKLTDWIYKNSAEARKELEERKLDFLPFPELKQAVQDDVKFLRGTKLMKNEVPLSGWAYEVELGKTVRVV